VERLKKIEDVKERHYIQVEGVTITETNMQIRGYDKRYKSMSRRIIIDKYQGNTHYSVHVIDSFGQEHHLGYYTWLNDEEIEKRAKIIWSNETKKEVSLMSKAIKECIDIDIKNGIEPSLD